MRARLPSAACFRLRAAVKPHEATKISLVTDAASEAWRRAVLWQQPRALLHREVWQNGH
jgi:hypothetical protein